MGVWTFAVVGVEIRVEPDLNEMDAIKTRKNLIVVVFYSLFCLKHRSDVIFAVLWNVFNVRSRPLREFSGPAPVASFDVEGAGLMTWHRVQKMPILNKTPDWPINTCTFASFSEEPTSTCSKYIDQLLMFVLFWKSLRQRELSSALTVVAL